MTMMNPRPLLPLALLNQGVISPPKVYTQVDKSLYKVDLSPPSPLSKTCFRRGFLAKLPCSILGGTRYKNSPCPPNPPILGGNRVCFAVLQRGFRGLNSLSHHLPFLILWAFTFCLLPLPGAAQPIEGLPETELRPILPTPPTLPEPEPLPTLEELLPPVKPPTQRQFPPSLEAIPDAITVEQFKVMGSTVLTEAELAEVLQPYTGEGISFVKLLEAQNAIIQLYVKKGYINSGAFIPPQEIQDGVVIIRVIEGKLEEIKVTGLERLAPGYVRSRLELGAQTPLNREKLLLALQLLQLDPLIERLSANLTAGSRPGISILEVEVKEADAGSVRLALDNQRSPSVGSVRRLIDLEHLNLIDFGDRFHVNFFNTDGSNSLDDLRYTIPINPRNGTIALSHRRTYNDIIEEPFDRLDIESENIDYQISYRQPLFQTPSSEFILELAGASRKSETSLFNEPFPLAPGANEEGKIRIYPLRFAQEYVNRDPQKVLAVRSQFSVGLDIFDATENDDAPDGQFLTWRGQAQYLRLLTPETILLLRTDLQLANDALVSIEQFGAGGQLSVRGYRQDALVADNGLFASLELRQTILRLPKQKITLQLTPFFDFGTVWNNSKSDFEISEPTIYSLGIGLRLAISDKFNARLDWGIPLVDLGGDKDTLQEQGLYFQINFFKYRF